MQKPEAGTWPHLGDVVPTSLLHVLRGAAFGMHKS